MKLGDIVVYRVRNTVGVGRWVKMSITHKAVIKVLRPGNDTYVLRGMNQIKSVSDIVSKYGLGSPEMTVEEKNSAEDSNCGKYCRMFSKHI